MLLSRLFLLNGALCKSCLHILSEALEEVWKTEIPFQHFNSALFTVFPLKRKSIAFIRVINNITTRMESEFDSKQYSLKILTSYTTKMECDGRGFILL